MEPPPAGANVGHLSAVHTQIGVDERILSEKADEEVIEVMNGCICCTVRGDLVVALKKLHAKVSLFDAIIIETTGLADPAPVAQTFFVDDEIQALALTLPTELALSLPTEPKPRLVAVPTTADARQALCTRDGIHTQSKRPHPRSHPNPNLSLTLASTLTLTLTLTLTPRSPSP